MDIGSVLIIWQVFQFFTFCLVHICINEIEVVYQISNNVVP